MSGIGQVKHRMPEDIRLSIGVQIADARARRNVTQAELARLVGYESPKQIHRIECGYSTPSVVMLARICEVLEVSMDRVTKAVRDC
jgi:transcriptional regulator with XRE-family HTH domain